MAVTVRSTVRGLIRRAGPAFVLGTLGSAGAVVGFALTVATAWELRFIHMTMGLMFASINVFLGVVLEPVCSRLDLETRASVYSHMTPKLTVLLPTLLVTTISTGLPLALQLRPFLHAAWLLAVVAFVTASGVALAFGWQFEAWRDWRWAVPATVGVFGTLLWVGLNAARAGLASRKMMLTLLDGTLLLVVGLGVILSGDLRLCRELQVDEPDPSLVARLGQRNAALARLQAILLFFIVSSVVV